MPGAPSPATVSRLAWRQLKLWAKDYEVLEDGRPVGRLTRRSYREWHLSWGTRSWTLRRTSVWRRAFEVSDGRMVVASYEHRPLARHGTLRRAGAPDATFVFRSLRVFHVIAYHVIGELRVAGQTRLAVHRGRGLELSSPIVEAPGVRPDGLEVLLACFLAQHDDPRGSQSPGTPKALEGLLRQAKHGK